MKRSHKVVLVQKMYAKRISRREMLKGLGLAAAGTALAACGVPGMFDSLGVRVPCTTWWR